ncbi:hypothetical protein AMAG_10550 [Allomyces macrogynus ATCC 38327]|uniref:Uncharacterized protein n=1 Tax=Allomyces macrogynus (strain ATCC 38327) TaxID=578462 RepID=A0A0L0SV36_ALLM3|nr:hypothetical protein AMAG_10550 [Allomyces macrogynus ATCC 38327]|eukprot:KNE66326.1 hypothetical protein AMAG_10550 [Allomyces macrogynus ATCC 38327]
MGRCTWTLTQELETYCEWGLHDTTIYAPSMRFYDPHTGTHLRGRTQYLLGARILRCALRLWFVDPHLVLTSVQQNKAARSVAPDTESESSDPDPDDGALRVSFLFTGVPRWRWWGVVLATGGGSTAALERALRVYEGRCMYTFDRHGKIHAHWIETLVPKPTLWRVPDWWRMQRGMTVDEWRAGWQVRAPARAVVPPPSTPAERRRRVESNGRGRGVDREG